MKALYFTKIDYIRSRTQMGLILVILIFVTFLMRFMTDGTDLTIFLYSIFIVIVFSTIPFGNCTREDAGFLQLLPANTWQRVLGRFLFGLSLLALGFVISAVFTAAYRLTGKAGNSTMALPFYLIMLAVGMVIITLQYIFLYLMGENRGQQFLSLVRMIPGMCFYFGTMSLLGKIKRDPARVVNFLKMIGDRLELIGWGSMIFALAVMAAGVILCTKVTEKKDF